MAYQETVRTSYGSRVAGGFKGIIRGFLLLIIGTVLLWWNEGRTLKTSDANKEAYEVTTQVSDLSTINNTLNGKMIFSSGLATTKDSLVDHEFNIGANAIKLIRKVEYYQWVQHSSSKSKDKFGGAEETTITYTYEKKWVSSAQNSAEFKDPDYKNKNFTLSTIESESFLAPNVTIGAYKIPDFLSSQISGAQDLYVQLSKEKIQAFNTTAKNILQSKTNILEKPYQPNGEYVHVNANEVYLGANPSVPAIGDVRITFQKVMPTDVSIWAKVNNDTFEEYISDNGYKVSSISTGVQSLDKTFQDEQDANSITAWLLRLLGTLLVIYGLKDIFNILVIILKVIPFLSSIANLGVNLVCIPVGLVWSLIVIAIAWIFYRPILAILLLAASGALIFFLVKRAKEKKKQNSEELVSTTE